MTAFICEEVAMEQTCCTKLGEGRVADYCKHASTAMLSIVDVHAEDKLKAKEAKRKAAEASSAAKRLNIEEADRTKIEATLPGETKRIEEGLASFGGDKVLKHLQREAKILKGLKLITALFPKSILPPKKLEHCLRCALRWVPVLVLALVRPGPAQFKIAKPCSLYCLKKYLTNREEDAQMRIQVLDFSPSWYMSLDLMLGRIWDPC